MANKRIFYATQGVKLTPIKEEGDPAVRTSGTPLIPGGLQSVGVTTNFNLEKIFQLGQLELYDSIENNPEVEVTLNKVFDGTKPLFLMVMGGASNATSGDLLSLQNNLVSFELFVHPDTGQSTAGQAVSRLQCTGMYASSFTYTFPTDGNATEEVTLVGTNKTWEKDPGAGSSVFTQNTTSKATTRRWKFNTASSVFPTGDGGMPIGSPLTNVTVSFDLGREPVYTLGSYEPYMRPVSFPVEISTEITSLGIDGDFLNINDVTYACVSQTGNTISYKPIKFVICGSGENDKLSIDLGEKNKLNSINYSGGDTGGGNVEISYSFTSDNIFKMIASGSFQTDGSGVAGLSVSEPVPYTFGRDDN